MAARKKTENEDCILREVTDGLLRWEIWIQANAEDDPRTYKSCPMCRKCYGVYIFVILQISLAQCVESVMVYTY
jgi:hypothetical protein